MVQREGLSELIETDSCGTGSWHICKPPDSRARSEATRRGIVLEDLRGRAIDPDDFTTFDYILAMDKQNLADLQRMCPAPYLDKLHLFLKFSTEDGRIEVPDPYYGGPTGFSDVFDLVTAGAEGLLGHIRYHHPNIDR
jgi:protein-tyrosine phosphatase